MKKIITLFISLIILLSAVSIATGDHPRRFKNMPIKEPRNCESILNLPNEYVGMVVYYGTESYFDTTLSQVPSGYNIENKTYQGWCIQRNVAMTTGVLHTVVVYSSYSCNLPEIWQDEDWDKVNYILNHKQGDKMDIQDAIWYFIHETELPDDPDAQAMIAAADLNGEDFCPGVNGIIAVCVDSGLSVDPVIQRSIIEVSIQYEGCNKDFWTTHTEDWVDYDPIYDLIGFIFTIPPVLPCSYMLSIMPLHFALRYLHGGDDVCGAAEILLVQAIAAILNAAHPSLNYPLTEYEIINQVNSALASLNRDIILFFADELSLYNNLESDFCCY